MHLHNTCPVTAPWEYKGVDNVNRIYVRDRGRANTVIPIKAESTNYRGIQVENRGLNFSGWLENGTTHTAVLWFYVFLG